MIYNLYLILIVNFILSLNEFPKHEKYMFFTAISLSALANFFNLWPKFFKYIVFILICAYQIYFWGYKFTTISSIAFLFNLSTLKLLEKNSKNDLFHSFFLIILTGACLIILNPDITNLTWVIFSYVFLLVSYLRTLKSHIEVSLKSLFFILPSLFFSLLLFFSFPRFTQGFYGNNVSQLIQDFGIKRLTFDALENVEQSNHVVFKAIDLPKKYLDLSNLYWRETVYATYKGSTFFENSNFLINDHPFNTSSSFSYNIKPSVAFKKYLPHLDTPSSIDQKKYYISKSTDSTYRFSHIGSSHNSYSIYIDKIQSNPKPKLQKYLTIGETNVEKLFSSFPQLRKIPTNTPDTVLELKKFFVSRNFEYNISPQKYVDFEDFLLNGKDGYCMHFSMSFALLLRIFQVPSRLISGYQGGEINPYNGTVNIRSLDGHMWVEYFLNNQWIRIDPTEFVAPGKSRTDNSQFYAKVDPKNASSLFFLRNAFLYFDFLLSEVDLAISSIDQEFQKQFFKKILKVSNFIWAICLFAFIYALFLLVCYFKVPGEIRRYKKLISDCSEIGIVKNPEDTALEFYATLVSRKYDRLSEAKIIIDQYYLFNYRKKDE